MSKALYRFTLDWGRYGKLTSLFVAEQEKVRDLIGRKVNFYSAFGKHSEVIDEVREDMLTVLTTDPDFIAHFELYGCETGPNPLTHIYEEENEDE